MTDTAPLPTVFVPLPVTPQVLPLVIEAVADGSSGGGGNPVVAVRTLGQVVSSTGCVMRPYAEYPQLLQVISGILSLT